MTRLLFLDVDGTLIPYDGSTLAEPADVWAGRPDQANPYLGRINLALGPRLLALPAELMWATGWLHLALAQYGPEAAAAVPEILQAPLDRWAVQALGRVGPAATDAVPAIRHALNDGDSNPVVGAAVRDLSPDDARA